MATFSNASAASLLAKTHNLTGAPSPVVTNSTTVPLPVAAPNRQSVGKPVPKPVDLFLSIAYELNRSPHYFPPSSDLLNRQVKKIAPEDVPLLNLQGIGLLNGADEYDAEDSENRLVADRDDYKVESIHSKKYREDPLPPQLETQREWNKILNGDYFGKPDWNLKLAKDLKHPIFISSCFYLKYPLKLIRAFIEFGFKKCNDHHILRHLINYPVQEALNFAKYFRFFGFKETSLSNYLTQHLISKELVEPLILDSSCRDFSNSEQDVLAALQRIEKFRQLGKSIELKAFMFLINRLCRENVDIRILKAFMNWHPVALPFALEYILEKRSAKAFRYLLKHFPLEILLKNLAPKNEESLKPVLIQIEKFPSIKVSDSLFNSWFLKFQNREIHPQILQALIKWRPDDARVALDQLIWKEEWSIDAFKHLLDLIPFEFRQKFCTPTNRSQMPLVLTVLPRHDSEEIQSKLSIFLANGYSITTILLDKILFEPTKFAAFTSHEQISKVLNPRIEAYMKLGIKIEVSALARIFYQYCHQQFDADILHACISWNLTNLGPALDELLSRYQLNDAALNILLSHFSLEKLLGTLTLVRRSLTLNKIQNLRKANISAIQFTHIFVKMTRYRIDQEILRAILEAFPAQAKEQLHMFIRNNRLSFRKLENILKQLPKDLIASDSEERLSIFSFSLAESQIGIDRIKLLIKYHFSLNEDALRYVNFYQEDAEEFFGLLVDNGIKPNEQVLKQYLLEGVSSDIILETIEILKKDGVKLSADFMANCEDAEIDIILSKYPELYGLLSFENNDAAPA